MAGNTCEELSPTGEAKTEPGLTALFSGSLRSSQFINHKCSKHGDLSRTQ